MKDFFKKAIKRANKFIDRLINDPKYRIEIGILCILLLVPALCLVYVIDIHNIGVYGDALPIARISGNSMEPTYHSGEWILYYTPDKMPVTNGSVIIYQKALSKKYVIHRVVQINPDGTMITQGDNNPKTDQLSMIDARNVTQKDVYGIVAGPLL